MFTQHLLIVAQIRLKTIPQRIRLFDGWRAAPNRFACAPYVHVLDGTMKLQRYRDVGLDRPNLSLEGEQLTRPAASEIRRSPITHSVALVPRGGDARLRVGSPASAPSLAIRGSRMIFQPCVGSTLCPHSYEFTRRARLHRGIRACRAFFEMLQQSGTCLVLPALRLSEQLPAFVRMIRGTLSAERGYRAHSAHRFHSHPPVFCPNLFL